MRYKFSKSMLAIGLSLSMATSTITIMAQEEPPMTDGGEKPDGGPGGGADTQTYDYSGETNGKKSADNKKVSVKKKTITTESKDENAALVKNGATLTISNSTLNKSGDDEDGDNCNFYGINSILLSMNDDSKAYISDSELHASSQGSNGIFATDSGTVYANGDTIETTADNSRGLDATYSGTIIANDMNINTKGEHSAAIATDRGGGSISVATSNLETEGSGSPLLYSTGNIQVDNVTGTADGSQIAGMEGLNTILIYNSNLKSTITKATASDPIANGIIIYQSTSGDAEAATGESATFQAVDSKLSSSITSGSMFYITNTNANVYLKNTSLNFDSDNAKLLTIAGNDSNNWGTSGSNGATVNLTADEEKMTGDIDVDTISSLNLYLINGTKYTGAVNVSENSENETQTDAPITINISKDSTWVVTGDSTVTNLNMAKGAKVVDGDGNTVTIKNNDKTVVKGKSQYTITVTGSYSTKVNTDDAPSISKDFIDRDDFDNYYNLKTTFSKNK